MGEQTYQYTNYLSLTWLSLQWQSTCFFKDNKLAWMESYPLKADTTAHRTCDHINGAHIGTGQCLPEWRLIRTEEPSWSEEQTELPADPREQYMACLQCITHELGCLRVEVQDITSTTRTVKEANSAFQRTGLTNQAHLGVCLGSYFPSRQDHNLLPVRAWSCCSVFSLYVTYTGSWGPNTVVNQQIDTI